jgi:hypothetical protein
MKKLIFSQATLQSLDNHKKVKVKVNPHLSLWEILTKARHFSQRKIKVLTQTDRRELAIFSMQLLMIDGDR